LPSNFFVERDLHSAWRGRGAVPQVDVQDIEDVTAITVARNSLDIWFRQ
jgi:hypothetical protein